MTKKSKAADADGDDGVDESKEVNSMDEEARDDTNGDAAGGNEEGNTMDTTSNSDGDAQKQDEKEKEEDVVPDYGGLGWRFCKWTVRKVST